MGSSEIEKLRVLLVGNGGREHALAWKLSQSPLVAAIYVAPGNGGTARGLPKVQNLPDLGVSDFAKLVDFARNNGINLVVPGPEQPLVDGIVDYFHENLANIRVFGPNKQAAALEGSKVFSKDFMQKFNIPTARYLSFDDVEKAREHVKSVDYDIVIKATGLAAGKGVILPASREEALTALDDMMVKSVFGAAGAEVVIEERLVGQEISILSFCDGYTAKSLPPAQDHKPVGDGDTGPNTGGMGCFGPAEVASPEILREIHRTILQPTLGGMRKMKTPFVGLLFTGYMLTADGPKLLEYNARFGDPETQTLLPLMQTDLAEAMIACTDRYLDALDLEVHPNFSTTVIAAADGYPGPYPKGQPITIDGAANAEGFIFHAGTALSSDELATAGGRVIAATSMAENLRESVRKAYDLMKTIRFENMHYRKDIAQKGLKQVSKTADDSINSGKKVLHAQKAATQSSNPEQQESMTYAAAGVSITAGNDLVKRIRPLVAKTARPGSDAQIGGFGGTFCLSAAGYTNSPNLTTGTDGVGSKLMIAQAMNKHDTIGIDLVAMNVNDIVVQGAEPLYLTDVYSCHSLDVDIATEVVRGICDGCIQANCALLGGETAEMGSMFQPGEYDVTAATTGAVPEGQRLLPDLESMREGDVLLGLESSGCHSNGFSLIRRILERKNLQFSDPCPWSISPASSTPTITPTYTSWPVTVGEFLLTPTRIYVRPLLALVRSGMVKGMAHITGGGLVENVPRMLPKHLKAELGVGQWPVPHVMTWLKKAGNVSDAEFVRVFNAGLGMVIVVAKEDEDKAGRLLAREGETVWHIGALKAREEGGEGCEILGMEGWFDDDDSVRGRRQG